MTSWKHSKPNGIACRQWYVTLYYTNFKLNVYVYSHTHGRSFWLFFFCLSFFSTLWHCFVAQFSFLSFEIVPIAVATWPKKNEHSQNCEWDCDESVKKAGPQSLYELVNAKNILYTILSIFSPSLFMKIWRTQTFMLLLYCAWNFVFG